jgi:hypothetical protein
LSSFPGEVFEAQQLVLTTDFLSLKARAALYLEAESVQGT